MNEVRERVLLGVTPYMDYQEHRDLISICICSEYFTDYEDDNVGIEPDFSEVIAIIEKDWLFAKMRKEGIENPLQYLKEEYTSDDSISWYDEALIENKVVMIAFN